ncbi:MAG: T9SS type A sorting domain-containing protein [Vicingaceae bacterium]
MNISTWLNTSKILLGLASLICSFTLTANTVMVTNTNNSGAGSLRTAMQSTVQNGDTIRFDPALIAGGDATITLLTPIFTTKDITIIGLYNNTATLYISGGATSQIFSINHLNTSAPQRSLTLDSLVFINATAQRGTHLMFTGNNLTIKNSILRDGVSILEGGSIHFTSIALTSTLDIDNSEFYDNESESGGAIFTNGVRNVTVNNSKFHHNEALSSNGKGGGITVKGQCDLDINNSMFYNNLATQGEGGALFINSSGATASDIINLNITGSSFHNNTALFGAGIKVYYVNPTVVIKTSTFTNNNAITDGGAVDIRTSGSNIITSLTVENSTIFNNASFGTGGVGSGIYMYNSSFNSDEFLTIKGSIIADNGNNNNANNIHFSGNLNNGGSGFTSNGHNLLGMTSMFNSTFAGTDVLGVTAAQLNLGVIQNNGGETFTMMPGTGSLALNNGDTLDVTDAQNGAITDGFRDRGAAEYFCIVPITLSPNICSGSYTSPSGNNSWNTSGTYTETISGNGCDTIYTINLNVGTPSSSTDMQNSCGAYTWIDGVTYSTDTNSVTHTLTNASGCDSVVTLNLTINTINTLVNTVGTTLFANNTSATSYQWINCLNNTIISGATNASYTATSNGDYAVIITEGSCSDTSSCETILTVGINDLEQNKVVNIYPNPVQNQLFIELNNEAITKLDIIDFSGKLILSKTDYTKKSVDVSNLPQGIYVLRISTQNGITINRFIKQ